MYNSLILIFILIANSAAVEDAYAKQLAKLSKVTFCAMEEG